MIFFACLIHGRVVSFAKKKNWIYMSTFDKNTEPKNMIS